MKIFNSFSLQMGGAGIYRIKETNIFSLVGFDCDICPGGESDKSYGHYPIKLESYIGHPDIAEIIKSQQVPCWDWYKEETDLVNSL